MGFIFVRGIEAVTEQQFKDKEFVIDFGGIVIGEETRYKYNYVYD